MSENCRKQHHEFCVLFLDDAFCSDRVAKPLIEAGFSIQKFTTHFPESAHSNKPEQSVKDRLIIELCHRRKWIILTRDHNMRVTHIETLKKNPNVMILATASNGMGDLASWVQALISAKDDVEKKYRRQERPWYAQYNRQGQITVCKTVDCTMTTRRTRPKEH